MNRLIHLLILFAIAADVFAMSFWFFISPRLYYIGEAVVYFLWTLAFFLRNKYEVTEFQKFFIDLLLGMWIPFTLNTIQRNIRDVQGDREIWDYLFFALSALWLVYKTYLWFKGRKKRSELQ